MKDLSTLELIALAKCLCGKFLSAQLPLYESRVEIKDDGDDVQNLRVLNRVFNELVSRIELLF